MALNARGYEVLETASSEVIEKGTRTKQSEFSSPTLTRSSQKEDVPYPQKSPPKAYHLNCQTQHKNIHESEVLCSDRSAILPAVENSVKLVSLSHGHVDVGEYGVPREAEPKQADGNRQARGVEQLPRGGEWEAHIQEGNASDTHDDHQ